MKYEGKPSFTAEIVQAEESGIQQYSSTERADTEIQLDAAHRYPRTMSRFLQEATEMATMTEETAESCIYSVPRANKQITGPSVRLAEICASAYGNLHIGVRIKQIDEKEIVAESAIWDLEKNNRFSVESRRRIVDKNGYRYNDDMINVTGAAASSIALRNAILRIIPRAYVDQIYARAKKVAIGTQTTFVTKRASLLERLRLMGIGTDRVLARVKRAAIEDVTMADVELLIGLGTAIKNNETDIDVAFPAVEAPAPKAEPPKTEAPKTAEQPTKTEPKAAAPAEPPAAKQEPKAAAPAQAKPAPAESPAKVEPKEPAPAKKEASETTAPKVLDLDFKKRIVDRFEVFEVTEDRILGLLGRKVVGDITQGDIDLLLKIGKSLRNREIDVDTAFPPVAEAPEPDPLPSNLPEPASSEEEPPKRRRPDIAKRKRPKKKQTSFLPEEETEPEPDAEPEAEEFLDEE